MGLVYPSCFAYVSLEDLEGTVAFAYGGDVSLFTSCMHPRDPAFSFRHSTLVVGKRVCFAHHILHELHL